MKLTEIKRSIEILDIVCTEGRISPERIYDMFDSKDEAVALCRILKEKGAGRIEFTKEIYCFIKNEDTLTIKIQLESELKKLKGERRNKYLNFIWKIIAGTGLILALLTNGFGVLDRINKKTPKVESTTLIEEPEKSNENYNHTNSKDSLKAQP